VTGVGYNASGRVMCNHEVVRDGSHPSFTKLMEVLVPVVHTVLVSCVLMPMQCEIVVSFFAIT